MTDFIINISVDEAIAQLASGAVLLDVREDDEWDAGHAPQARHIRLSEIPDRFDELPRDQVIVCICHLGGRSGRATAYLAEQGFSSRNVEGGMVQWELQQQEIVASP